MADYVKATVTANHYGSNGMRLVGQEIEITQKDAAELQHRGLVTYEGPSAKPARGPNVLATENSPVTTTVLTSDDENMVPANKKELADQAPVVNAAAEEQKKSRKKAEQTPLKEKADQTITPRNLQAPTDPKQAK